MADADRTDIRTTRPRRRWLAPAAVVAAIIVAAIWSGVRALDARHLKRELAAVDADMKAQYFGSALERLFRVKAAYPGQAEVLFRIGLCEEGRGRSEEAIDAWHSVPPHSAFGPAAAAKIAMAFVNQGRFTQAEAALDRARGGPPSVEFDRALALLLRRQGRLDEARVCVRESWGRAPDPGTILWQLWMHDKAPYPVETWQASLDQADQDDDRVWLARARIGILTGQLDTANRWIESCLKRRPDDQAVWRARLDWAREAKVPAAAWTAAEHLHARGFSRVDVLSIRAWFAARRGDADAERKALEELVACHADDTEAWEQLAALAVASGQRAEAERLHRERGQIDDVQDRVRKILLPGGDLAPHAEELARLTRILGRLAESRGWEIIHERKSSRGPIGVNIIHAGDAESPPPDARTDDATRLADLLADLRPAASGGTSAQSKEGGAVKPEFVDDAEPAHLATFTYDNGQTPLHQLPETMSGGGALIDFDMDGWLDFYAVQGGLFDAGPSSPIGDHLFRNNRDGTFTDVTERSGIARFKGGYGLGVTVGDYDNDGDADVFVSRLRTYNLFRNKGDGTFEDVTESSGLAGTRDNPTSAAFVDLDNDGDLDLYVCHYMLYDPANPRVCRDPKGGYFYCDPSKVDPAPDHVFRNDRGRFVDVTAEAGFTDPGGRGLGVIAADVDNDHKIDLFVANDGTANYLFHNLGGFKFEEVGRDSGVAANATGTYQAGMGVACADLDGDGLPEVMVTNFYGEGATLYQNLGNLLFTDRSLASGLGVSTRYRLGFGMAAFDFDNDSRSDVMIVNGHVNDSRPGFPYQMAAQLFANDGRGKLIDVSKDAGKPWEVLRLGRGLAVGDVDNDGRVDAIVVAQNDPLAYFHNRTRGGHFVVLRLVGTKSNRDAIGAVVTIKAGGRTQVLPRFGGGSYQSAGDLRIHAGLGSATRVESIEVLWPSGQTGSYRDLTADTGYLLREGATAPEPLAGYRAK
jgi:tetratricopeptide (TPR) repeat protein